ncbi:helix-turn-helix transcriptional regulator [Verrucomicrobiota bacterium]
MDRSKTQFERLKALDGKIRAGEYPNRRTFAEEWEVSIKTVQRDIDFMRDRLGAPIEYDSANNGYYYTEPSWFLGSLPIKEGDLFSLLIARQAVQQYQGTPIARKLETVYDNIADALSDKLEIRPEEIPAEFSFVNPPAIPIDETIWETVCRAILDRRTLSAVYKRREAKQATARKIDPYHMANIQGDWYVFARSHNRDRVQQFAIGRFESVELTDERYILPSDFSAEELMNNTFGRYASMEKMTEVRILIKKEATLDVEDRTWHPQQKLTKRDNGDVELCFPVSGGGNMPFFNVKEWVLSKGRYARVLAPEQLKEIVAEEIRIMSQNL